MISDWLKSEAGLELSASKTRYAHTDVNLEDELPGFDFLGFNVHRYLTGMYRNNKLQTGMRTLIKPSMGSIKKHYAEIKRITRTSQKAEEIIIRLTPVIRGWCHYFKTGTSKMTFSKLRYLTWKCLWFGLRQSMHSKRGAGYVYSKYFVRGSNQLQFGTNGTLKSVSQQLTLKYHNMYPRLSVTSCQNHRYQKSL